MHFKVVIKSSMIIYSHWDDAMTRMFLKEEMDLRILGIIVDNNL